MTILETFSKFKSPFTIFILILVAALITLYLEQPRIAHWRQHGVSDGDLSSRPIRTLRFWLELFGTFVVSSIFVLAGMLGIAVLMVISEGVFGNSFFGVILGLAVFLALFGIIAIEA